MIQEHYSLKGNNTFGIEVFAKYFSSFGSAEELKNLLNKFPNENLLILGGGSNVLFTEDFNGLVLKNDIKGISIKEENEEYVIIESGAGEIWHEFVCFCIENNYAGIENLSLIPGSVGASPMQNIGAYGVEIKDVFHALTAFHIASGEIHTFSHSDCEFGYRESVFKNKCKGQYVILSVQFKLSKNPKINVSYGAIQDVLLEKGIKNPGIKDVSDAVIEIRRSKLPDPVEIGNAGSFFKNPVVSEELAQQILNAYPDAPNYPAPNGNRKLAAGWLIEKAGWKGKRMEDYGVHVKQALVLVNYGTATGDQIAQLADQIIQSIQEKFGVTLEKEVNFY